MFYDSGMVIIYCFKKKKCIVKNIYKNKYLKFDMDLLFRK